MVDEMARLWFALKAVHIENLLCKGIENFYTIGKKTLFGSVNFEFSNVRYFRFNKQIFIDSGTFVPFWTSNSSVNSRVHKEFIELSLVPNGSVNSEFFNVRYFRLNKQTLLIQAKLAINSIFAHSANFKRSYLRGEGA
jgi:hypothetical protein